MARIVIHDVIHDETGRGVARLSVAQRVRLVLAAVLALAALAVLITLAVVIGLLVLIPIAILAVGITARLWWRMHFPLPLRRRDPNTDWRDR